MHLRAPTLLLALVILIAPPAVAQIGVAGGGIYSDASVSGTDIDTESRTGFQVGVSYATGGTLGVILGGYYSEKGFNVKDNSERVKLSYIEVPVMAVVRLPAIGRTIGPRLYGGVNGGFETSCDSSVTGDVALTGLCDETNSFDFGLKAGLGVQVFMFGLDLAYVHGLTDVAKSETLDVKNRAWSLTLLIGVG
jgi:hypothetical protein